MVNSAWQTIYYYFNGVEAQRCVWVAVTGDGQKKGLLARRNEQPTVGIMDSQGVKATLPSTGCNTGFDACKRTKRHIVTNSLGLLICMVVHIAGIQDRHGALLVLEKLKKCWFGTTIVSADGGYSGNIIDY